MQVIKFGDILSLNKGVIVHGCNAQGVMGSGLAAQIKSQYPECFKVYHDICKSEDRKSELLGQIIPYSCGDLIIINAIVQLSFGKDGKKYVSYKALDMCFRTLSEVLDSMGEQEVHYPLIGAGLGGGEWSIISQIIDSAFHAYPKITRNLWIYE